MQEGAKKRLVGAVVVVVLAVIFVPLLFPDPDSQEVEVGAKVLNRIPDEPPFEPQFNSETFLTPDEAILGEIQDEPLTDPAPVNGPGSLGTPAGASEEDDRGYEIAFDEPAAPVSDSVAEAAPAVPAPSAPPPLAPDDGMPSWVVQVASLGSAESAEEMAQQLRGQGYSAFVEPARVSGRLFYRVRVGPELDRANADRIARRLADQFRDRPFVSRYP